MPCIPGTRYAESGGKQTCESCTDNTYQVYFHATTCDNCDDGHKLEDAHATCDGKDGDLTGDGRLVVLVVLAMMMD